MEALARHWWVVTRRGLVAVVFGTLAFARPGLTALVLLPVYAPWCKIAEVIDYARAVTPRLSVPIHDALLTDIGLGLVDRLLGPQGPGIGADYRRLGPTDWLDLPSHTG